MQESNWDSKIHRLFDFCLENSVTWTLPILEAVRSQVLLGKLEDPTGLTAILPVECCSMRTDALCHRDVDTDFSNPHVASGPTPIFLDCTVPDRNECTWFGIWIRPALNTA